MLQWAVNVSMLFQELPFLERFQAAVDAGFSAVEFPWMHDVNLDELVAAVRTANVKVVLFNMDGGRIDLGERGLANDANKRAWWRERAELALELAPRLNAPRINVLAGNQVVGMTRTEMLDVLCENLAWAIPRAEANVVTLMLEPINPIDVPTYLLPRATDAVQVIQKINSPSLQLQFDAYHTQRAGDDPVQIFLDNLAYIGHIQIADVPGRHQPGTGEINYRRMFETIERSTYSGYIGLEYSPQPNTLASLAWLPMNRRRTCATADLLL